VLNLLLQEDVKTKKCLYPLYQYIFWLNNLFISIKLLQRLHKEGIGAAKTVRMVKIQHKKQNKDLIPKYKEHIQPSLIDLKLIHKGQIP
jgi:hypothetical protein